MKDWYPNSLVPKHIREFNGKFELTKDDLIRLFKGVKSDSSPGYPWSNFGSTKREAFNEAQDILLEALNHRLNLLYNSGPATLRGEGQVPRLKAGLVDPVRVFVKNEPHSIEKLNKGRYRIICSVSLLDELVDRVLFDKQNKTEIENWEICPSKPGIGFSTNDQLEAVHQMFQGNKRGSDTLLFSDMSAYDWKQKEYMFRMDLDFRYSKLVGLKKDKETWLRIASARYELVVDKVWALSNGKLFRQSHPGILPSGWANTSATNSRGRVLMALICGSTYAVAMGDDAGEWLNKSKLEQIIENYLEFGFDLKPSYSVDPTEPFVIDFCSHKISKTDRIRAEPVNWVKTVVKYLQSADIHDPSKFAELQDNLKDLDEDKKGRVNKLVRELRLEFPEG